MSWFLDLRRSPWLSWLRRPYLRAKAAARRRDARRAARDARCPVCGGARVDVVHATVFHGYLACEDCGLAWVARPPSEAWLDRFYQEMFRGGREEFHAADDWSVWLAFKEEIFGKLGLETTPRGEGRLLEIGSGEGLLLERVRSLGWRVEGIERNRELARGLQERGFTVQCGDLMELALEPGTYDLLLAFHVLEHLRDPRGALRRMAEWLRPGGELVLETPLSRNWESVDHLFFFSRRALERLLFDLGFELLGAYDYRDGRHPEFHNLAVRAVRRAAAGVSE